MKNVILITGAVGGIGTAMCRELAARGYNLLLVDRRPDEAGLTEQIARQYGVETRFRLCDLSDADERSALLQDFAREEMRFSGLINVAGRDFEGAFCEKSREQMLFLTRVLVETPVDLAHSLLALRDERQRFLLINISSLAAFFPMPYKATYAAAKRFILDHSRALHVELKDIADVLVICPAGLPTTEESRRKIAAQGLWGRLTAQQTEKVVRRAVELALRGQAVYVPGVASQFLTWLGGLLPAGVVAGFVGRRWRAAQARVAAGLSKPMPPAAK
ncbi:SDR family NAD(P)-dependent oxidoreductase [Ornatilinea apprima]|uniref:SDR family NAD(P)-dependent oxidoreductase n=1 Tax=Ornatilinea apprima TaxID=1134406 RepID=UPI00094638C9|nr:SDR family NAD(P)-dependent oxidoreductase [Ornatilinea apprima]